MPYMYPDLNAARATYGSEIQRYHTVAFQLTLTGSNGSQRLVGVMPMARTAANIILTVAPTLATSR